MTLRGTWLAIGVLVATGAGIMHISYRAQDLEARLQQANAAIEAERQRIHVLEAEWAYLSRPQRIKRLADTHLLLTPTPSTRLARIADLPRAPNSAGGERPAPAPARAAEAPLPRARPVVPAPPGRQPSPERSPEAPGTTPSPNENGLLRAADGPTGVPDDLIRDAVQRTGANGEAP